MKLLVLFVGMILTATTVRANPLFDVVFGGVMVMTGGYFDYERSGARSDREEAEKSSTSHAISAIQADENAAYYAGAADWENIKSGHTSSYFALVNTSMDYSRTAMREIGQAGQLADSAGDSNNKEHLYKGVALTSYAVGGFFIAKGIVSYLSHGKYSTLARVTRNPIIRNAYLVPSRDMTGASLIWTVKI